MLSKIVQLFFSRGVLVAIAILLSGYIMMENTHDVPTKGDLDHSNHTIGRKQSYYPLKSTQLKLPDISLGKDQWMEASLLRNKSSGEIGGTSCLEKLPSLIPPPLRPSMELPPPSRPMAPMRFSRTLSPAAYGIRPDRSEEKSFDLFCKGTHYNRSKRMANAGLRKFSDVNSSSGALHMHSSPASCLQPPPTHYQSCCEEQENDSQVSHRMKLLDDPLKDSIKIPQLKLPSTPARVTYTPPRANHKEQCLIINFSIPLPTPESHHHHHHHIIHSANPAASRRRLFRPRDSKRSERPFSRELGLFNIQFNEVADQNVTNSTALKCALDKFIESSTNTSSKFESALNSMRKEKKKDTSEVERKSLELNRVDPPSSAEMFRLPPSSSASVGQQSMQPIPVKLISEVSFDIPAQQSTQPRRKPSEKKGVTLSDLKGYLASQKQAVANKVADTYKIRQSLHSGKSRRTSPIPPSPTNTPYSATRPLTNSNIMQHQQSTKISSVDPLAKDLRQKLSTNVFQGSYLSNDEIKERKKFKCRTEDKISACKGQYRLYSGTTRGNNLGSANFAIELSSQQSNTASDPFLSLSSRMMNEQRNRPSYPLKIVGGICRGFKGEIEQQRREGPFSGNAKHWKQLPPPAMSSRLSLLKMSSTNKKNPKSPTTRPVTSVHSERGISPWHNSTPSNLMVDSRNSTVQQTEGLSTPTILEKFHGMIRVDPSSSDESVAGSSSISSMDSCSFSDFSNLSTDCSICEIVKQDKHLRSKAVGKPNNTTLKHKKSTAGGKEAKTFSYANLKDIGPILKKKIMQLHDRQCGTIRRERRSKRKSLSMTIQKLCKGTKLNFSHSKNFN